MPDGTSTAHKDFEQYREDITILAGYYVQVFSVCGSRFVLRPKSISFANMEEEEFLKFYSAAVDAILKHVLIGWTIEEVDDVVGSFF